MYEERKILIKALEFLAYSPQFSVNYTYNLPVVLRKVLPSYYKPSLLIELKGILKVLGIKVFKKEGLGGGKNRRVKAIISYKDKNRLIRFLDFLGYDGWEPEFRCDICNIREANGLPIYISANGEAVKLYCCNTCYRNLKQIFQKHGIKSIEIWREGI